ncbi:MAG TPA: hypothetical protein VGL58_12885 [Caulobacteraceae bacterium]|jgi:opacity protein-like surface antigen
MRVLVVVAALLIPSLALADPAGRGWGLHIDEGGRQVGVSGLSHDLSGPAVGPAPSIQAGYGWQGTGVAALVGYDQPPEAHPGFAGPASNARVPGASAGDQPGVMGFSVRLSLR